MVFRLHPNKAGLYLHHYKNLISFYVLITYNFSADFQGLKSAMLSLLLEVFYVVTKRKRLVFNANLILIQEQLLLDRLLTNTIDGC